MKKPRIIVLAGYGLNCEEETAFAFERSGGMADIIHINDLIAKYKKIDDYQIIAIPGGFSYGDDTGSGKGYAFKLKNNFQEALLRFISHDKLILGICNGFQILTNAGLLAGALTFNTKARYSVRWVDLKICSNSPWLLGMSTFSCPIAHGEGRYFAPQKQLEDLQKNNMIALKYVEGHITEFFDLPANPNGSLKDIAGITDASGRVLGLMPHPERAMFFTQLPHWTFLKEKYEREKLSIPSEGPGLQIFKNGVNYFV